MILQSNFRPSWWLTNPHLQTIWASKCRRLPTLALKRERLELPDGDFVDLAWSPPTDGPLVCVFHGLAGSVKSTYIKGLIPVLEQAGFRVLFMHFRGCSGEPNRLAKSYHSGQTEDIRFLIQTAQERFPNCPLHAVGFSLGANALLCYLGEERDQCPLRSAIAVSPPLMLRESAYRMNSGFSRFYQWHLIKQMRKQYELRRQTYPELALPVLTDAQNNFIDFDDGITAPLNGFTGVDDYYDRCSSRQYLNQIEVATHIIHSRDDPFFSEAVVPQAADLSPAVTLELTERGGHVAFVTGTTPITAQYWLEQRIPALLLSSSSE